MKEKKKMLSLLLMHENNGGHIQKKILKIQKNLQISVMYLWNFFHLNEL